MARPRLLATAVETPLVAAVRPVKALKALARKAARPVVMIPLQALATQAVVA